MQWKVETMYIIGADRVAHVVGDAAVGVRCHCTGRGPPYLQRFVDALQHPSRLGLVVNGIEHNNQVDLGRPVQRRGVLDLEASVAQPQRLCFLAPAATPSSEKS